MKNREQLQATDENEQEDSVSADSFEGKGKTVAGSSRFRPGMLNVRYIELIDKARFRKWEAEQRKFQAKARKAY